jgi:DsbC/DsbD-like thiol-disulfide interchange protein
MLLVAVPVVLGLFQPVIPGSTIETAHVSIALSSAAPGEKAAARLFVDITPKPKMHVYAPGEKEGIPVQLTIDANPSVKAGKATFPPPQKYFFPPLRLTQLVFSSPFRITQPITIATAPKDGTLVVTGTLLYQACDDAVCYVPKTVPVKWTLKTR